MKVHLNQIPLEGLLVEGADPNTILDLHDEQARAQVRPIGDIRYRLAVGLSDGGLFATGEIAAEFELECVSCLERFRYPLILPDFACQVELTGAESVDLTEPIREDILLALPPHPHCDWNGEKVCSGASRVAKIHAAAADPLPQERDVWGALDQLKTKKT
jgi:uncharacterized metal-binding protein YceD (DUF177 family)